MNWLISRTKVFYLCNYRITKNISDCYIPLLKNRETRRYCAFDNSIECIMHMCVCSSSAGANFKYYFCYLGLLNRQALLPAGTYSLAKGELNSLVIANYDFSGNQFFD